VCATQCRLYAYIHTHRCLPVCVCVFESDLVCKAVPGCLVRLYLRTHIDISVCVCVRACLCMSVRVYACVCASKN